jgi:hypothetical protein
MAWALVVVIGVGLPVTAWWLTRNLKLPSQVIGGPGPRFDRVDHWLYNRYRFGVLNRSQVLNAVFSGQELHEQPLREAAHSLAAAVLAGKVGILYRWAGWIRICAGLAIVITVVMAALVQHNYVIIAAALVGVPQFVLGWLYQRKIRGRVERAHRLNG